MKFQSILIGWLKLKEVELFKKGNLEAYFRKKERKKNKNLTCIYLINVRQNHYVYQTHYHFSVVAKVQMLIYLTWKKSFFSSCILGLPPRLFDDISSYSMYVPS